MLDLTQEHDAHIDQRLRHEPIMWLSTVRPDGMPHLVPVWFLWNGRTILFFSQPNQKARNLRHNPHVVMALEAADDGDDVVRIEGVAELLAGEDTPTPALPAYAEKYAELLASMNTTARDMAASYAQAIRVTPSRFLE